MTRYLGDFLLALWLTFVMPVWVLMMLWGRRVFLLPYFADDAVTYAVLTAAMYLPLLVFGVTRSTGGEQSRMKDVVQKMLSSLSARRA